MNPITHLLVGWTFAERFDLEPRDREIVTWASVMPDLDGLGVVPDLVNRILGRPATTYYFDYHHLLGHGLPAAVAATIAVAFLGKRKVKLAALAFISFHLHLICDFLGSRGPTAADIWPIAYLQPLSDRLTFEWAGQWALNDWRNITLTLALLAFAGWSALRSGYSPVSLFSRRADTAVVSTLRARFARRSQT